MMIRGDKVTFETTKRVEYANHGIIGIGENLIYQGYDDQFMDSNTLTLEERRELADFMVQQWRTFREFL